MQNLLYLCTQNERDESTYGCWERVDGLLSGGGVCYAHQPAAVYHGKGGNGKDDFSEEVKRADAEEYGGCGSDRSGCYQCRRNDHSFVLSVARPDTYSNTTVIQATVCRTATYATQTEPDLSLGDAGHRRNQYGSRGCIGCDRSGVAAIQIPQRSAFRRRASGDDRRPVSALAGSDARRGRRGDEEVLRRTVFLPSEGDAGVAADLRGARSCVPATGPDIRTTAERSA